MQLPWSYVSSLKSFIPARSTILVIMLYTFSSFFTGMPNISFIHEDLVYWECRFSSSLLCCSCIFRSFMSVFNLWFSRWIFLLSSIRLFTLSLLSWYSSVRNFWLVSTSGTVFFNFSFSVFFSALYLARSSLTTLQQLFCPEDHLFNTFVMFLSFFSHPCRYGTIDYSIW